MAEEITQSTFLAVYRNLYRYRPGKSAGPWIFRIAQNMVRSSFRQKKSVQPTISLDQEIDEGKPMLHTVEGKELNPKEALRTKEFERKIQEALDSLPDKLREVLTLHDIEGLSYEEIQKTVHVPYKTVASRLAKARLILRKKLDPKSFGLHLFFTLRNLFIPEKAP